MFNNFLTYRLNFFRCDGNLEKESEYGIYFTDIYTYIISVMLINKRRYKSISFGFFCMEYCLKNLFCFLILSYDNTVQMIFPLFFSQFLIISKNICNPLSFIWPIYSYLFSFNQNERETKILHCRMVTFTIRGSTGPFPDPL